MADTSTATLMDALRQYRLLEPAQLEEAARILQCRFSDPKALAGELIRRAWLTPYQANQLLQGRGQELVLGSYILLERLGEGGMGAVFKARHRDLGRTVAIKLIRKERLDNPDAIRRFKREVQAAAHLDHSNVVHALDADQVGGTHLLVMECIEGATDLSCLVRKNGALPVPQACEYIRQAALGLQHAFERGMVHRDIKPANLLLTADGKTVKILDMGLARLDHAGADDRNSTMTQEGAIMGTPDYIAPEQALESHTVDIRADLYSLGCTFYFLLTRRVPFPTGTLLQKLNKHQNEAPPAVESLRSGVPAGVARVVRKLMAKRPEDRYQTPAEVVTALASVENVGSGAAAAVSQDDRTVVLHEERRDGSEDSESTLAYPFAFMAQGGVTAAADAPERLRRRAQQRRWLLLGEAGGLVVLVCVAVVLILALRQSAGEKSARKEGARSVASPPPPGKAPAKVADAWIKQVAAMPAEKQVEAVAAKLKELNPGFDGKLTHRVEEGVVTHVGFLTDNVTDISPVRALVKLGGLKCYGSEWGKGKLPDLSPLRDMKLTRLNLENLAVFDLSPLKGMKLTWLDLANLPVSDLSPLKGMELTSLTCYGTQVSDLSPLKGMQLMELVCACTEVSDLSPLKHVEVTDLLLFSTKVSDLSPLKGKKLKVLNLQATQVSDLSPLKGMELTRLHCDRTAVSDLSPLKDMPLKEIWCDFKPYRDGEILRSIKTLDKINDKPVKEFWKDVEAKKVEKQP